MYTEVKRCRICQNEDLKTIFSLGNQALNGVFPESPSVFVQQGPVDLVKCIGSKSCGLVQLKQSYDSKLMYGDNYGYRSGLNKSMINHLKSKVDLIRSYDILDNDDYIIDIGSNDATTLKMYPASKYNLIGIDPTGNKFRKYYTNEIELVPEFFSYEALKNKLNGKKAKVITSFSMFYDLEDPISFVKDIVKCLDDNGIWVFEQSYLVSMLEATSYDTICQEHIEYYALRQIEWILKKCDLQILDLDLNNVNGGSISVVAGKKHLDFDNKKKINDLFAIEEEKKLDSLDTYIKFCNKIENNKKDIHGFFKYAKEKNKTVYGIGASTKGNVLLQYNNLTEKDLIEIGEVNTNKFGTYTPGSLIPICNESQVLLENPDYLFILPWHFKEFFQNSKKFKKYNLVFPLPKLEILRSR